MRGKIILFFVALCLAFDFAFWTWIHINEWELGRGVLETDVVAVVQDSVCDWNGVRHIRCVNAADFIDKPTNNRVYVRTKHGGYNSTDSKLCYYMSDRSVDTHCVLTQVFVSKRHWQSAIIGFRCYDTIEHSYTSYYTKEASLWWAKPEPNFIECFFSLDFLNHLL